MEYSVILIKHVMVDFELNCACFIELQEEDEECRVFAAAKRKMMKLRAAKEKNLHA